MLSSCGAIPPPRHSRLWLSGCAVSQAPCKCSINCDWPSTVWRVTAPALSQRISVGSLSVRWSECRPRPNIEIIATISITITRRSIHSSHVSPSMGTPGPQVPGSQLNLCRVNVGIVRIHTGYMMDNYDCIYWTVPRHDAPNASLPGSKQWEVLVKTFVVMKSKKFKLRGANKSQC